MGDAVFIVNGSSANLRAASAFGRPQAGTVGRYDR